jgi:hypothetical protein
MQRPVKSFGQEGGGFDQQGYWKGRLQGGLEFASTLATAHLSHVRPKARQRNNRSGLIDNSLAT